MNAATSGQIIGTVLWLGSCAGLAACVVWQKGSLPLLREQGLALIALGLFALAPCTYLAMQVFRGMPSLVPGAVQFSGGLLLLAAAWRARKQRLDPEAIESTWVFRQKSAAVVLLALGMLIFSYFGSLGDVPAAEAPALFIDTIVLLIVVTIVGHIVVSVLHSPGDDLAAPRDERDRAVDLLSLRNAYYLLTAAFWTMPVIIIAQLPLLTALNIWFALLVAAEVVYYSSVIAYYRLGTG